jgi:hypothetical protein
MMGASARMDARGPGLTIVEISHVRKQLLHAIDAARARAQTRRERRAVSERGFETFLEMATPLVRQVASSLKAEGYAFTVFSPHGGLRLAADRGRDEFIDFRLDDAGDAPGVVARISYTRGSRVLDEERPVKAGAPPDAITEDELLESLLEALAPWLEKR